MAKLKDWKKTGHWRRVIQWMFLGWCLFLGVQFALFVRHFETLGQAEYYPRPPSVEGFLPIGALASLKAWLFTGHFDPIHPAALVLFLTFLAMALLTKKSFCSFICPVGALSEAVSKLAYKLFGWNFRLWRALDLVLHFVKYVMLFLLLKFFLFDASVTTLVEFMKAPYWAFADVRMLYFFTDMSTTSMVVISALSLLTLIYKNFWCRYLCPYGALLGLLSLLSPFKVSRDSSKCNGCGLCSRTCPASIDVHRKYRVHSPQCSGCLTCVSNCQQKGALSMAFWKRPLPGLVFVVTVMLLFSGGVLTGMLTNHWQTNLSYSDYQRLIPMAARFGN